MPTAANQHGIDLPFIPDDLMEALEERFPCRSADINDADRMIWFKAGQRQVVEYLMDQKKRQRAADAVIGLKEAVYMEGGVTEA